MRTAIIFVLGLALGVAVATNSQGTKIAGMNGVNHIGISVDNFDEAVAFYEQKMGFHEVDRIHNDKGETALVFVQVSRDTFLEIAPSNANRPVGFTHFGVNVDNISAAVSALRERGITVGDPRNVGTQWMIASITAPGGRIELTELGPESSLAKATSSWK
jgi:catechol 2,3-dioxygenase-like lactoylglutathione lyase family enzyme